MITGAKVKNELLINKSFNCINKFFIKKKIINLFLVIHLEIRIGQKPDLICFEIFKIQDYFDWHCFCSLITYDIERSVINL